MTISSKADGNLALEGLSNVYGRVDTSQFPNPLASGLANVRRGPCLMFQPFSANHYYPAPSLLILSYFVKLYQLLPCPALSHYCCVSRCVFCVLLCVCCVLLSVLSCLVSVVSYNVSVVSCIVSVVSFVSCIVYAVSCFLSLTSCCVFVGFLPSLHFPPLLWSQESLTKTEQKLICF